MQKLTRVQVTNFQSIAEANIELSNLTVLVGPGRSGKSAIIRAIQCALLNATGDDFIRHGCKETQVILSFEDETTIRWTKERGKGASYQFSHNGQHVEFKKIGRQVPEAIAEYLGIGELDIEQGFSLAPQIKDQFAPVFVLGESGSRQARILGKVTRLDAVVSAQMECKRRGDRFKRDVTYAEQELGELRAKRAELPDVEKLQQDLDVIQEKLTLAKQAYDLSQRLSVLLDRRAVVEAMLAVDLESIEGRFNKAQLGVEALEKVVPLMRRLAVIKDTAAGATDQAGLAKATFKRLQQEYAAACKEAEVCDHCPFR